VILRAILDAMVKNSQPLPGLELTIIHSVAQRCTTELARLVSRVRSTKKVARPNSGCTVVIIRSLCGTRHGLKGIFQWLTHLPNAVLETFYTSFITLEISLLQIQIRGPFEKFVDWRQCAAVMQREAVTIMSSFSGGGNVVVA
jgi:hypothetical protein